MGRAAGTRAARIAAATGTRTIGATRAAGGAGSRRAARATGVGFVGAGATGRVATPSKGSP